MRLCYPHKTLTEQQELAKKSMKHNIMTILELGIIWKRYGKNIQQLIGKIHGKELLEHAIKQRKGVLLAAPHIGHWEVLGLYLSQYQNFSLLYKPPKNKKIERIIHHYRGQAGAQQIPAQASGVKKILAALKNNHLVGILPDQQPKSGQGEFTFFFNQHAYTMTLFSRLAAKTHSPVIMAAAIKNLKSGLYDIHIDSIEKEIYSDTTTSLKFLNKNIEQFIALAPEQYQWTYKRFSIQPDKKNPYQNN